MSNGAIRFSEDNEWYTPKSLVDKFGEFDYDPATTEERAKLFGIPNYDTEETDGLSSDWTKYKKIWLNPPFTMKKEFFKKAVDYSEKTRGEIYVLLPISFLATKTFHEILGQNGGTIYLPDGRIKFENASGKSKSPAFGSVVFKISAGGINVVRIKNA